MGPSAAVTNNPTIPAFSTPYNATDVVITVAAEPTNPISKGLLQVKKAASYLITTSGLSTKAIVLGGATLLHIAIINDLFFAHKKENVVKNILDTLIPEAAAIPLTLGYLFVLVPLGARKAGQLIEPLLQGASPLVIKAAKGAIYLSTALFIAGIFADIVKDLYFTAEDEEELNPSLSSFKISTFPILLVLATLGTKHCIDLVSRSEDKLQAAVKKLQ
jgi:hypothetical protein